MYLQITSWCNMTCAHCCMSCSSNHVGEHMSMDTLYNALAMAAKYEEMIVIGGGEPTLHPKFKEIVYACIEATQKYTNDYCIDYIPWMATNGSQTKLMDWLFTLMHPEYEYFEDICDEAESYNCQYPRWTDGEPLIQVAISQDIYHDKSKVDARILELWKKHKHELRDVTGKEVQIGFSKTGSTTRCCCSNVQVKPDGSIFLCGCDDSPYLGNVNTGYDFDPKELNEYCECIQDISYIDDEDSLEAWEAYLSTSPQTVAEYVKEHQKPKRRVSEPNIPVQTIGAAIYATVGSNYEKSR